MAALDDLLHVEVTTRAEWRSWLVEHHEQRASIWLVTFKKSVRPELHLPYDDLVEEALCFGWVDGLVRKLDGERSKLLLSPRRPGSTWSRPNKRRVAHLVKTGRMAPAGLAVIERARADGSWTVLDEIEDLVEPPDLGAELDRDPAARAGWDRLPASRKKPLLWGLKSARRPETRAKRLTALMAEVLSRSSPGPG